jgi:hypothetical protein
MSWSLDRDDLKNADSAEAARIIEEHPHLPRAVKDYVLAGIEGIARYCGSPGGDAAIPKVTITGHGHLCEGVGSYYVTSATIDVRPVS